MKIIERICSELYIPYGTTEYYQHGDRYIFITKMNDCKIYDISYSLLDWITEYEYGELIKQIRNTSYRVCDKLGLEKYLAVKKYTIE